MNDESRTTAAEQKSEILEFRSSHNPTTRAIWLLIGTIVFLIVLIASSIFSLFIETNGPPILPIAISSTAVPLFMALWPSIKGPVVIRLNQSGIEVDRVMGRRFANWHQIREIQFGQNETAAGWRATPKGKKRPGQRTAMLLIDGSNKPIEIDDSIIQFDEMVREIGRRAAAARDSSVFDPKAQVEREKSAAVKEKRGLRYGGLILGALGLAAGFSGLHTMRQENLFKKNKTSAIATVERHYKFNVASRIEYSFDDAEGNPRKKDVMIRSGLWDSIQVGDPIEVYYDATNPENNRLVEGELEHNDSPVFFMGAGGLIGVFGLGAFAFSFIRRDSNQNGPAYPIASDANDDAVVKMSPRGQASLNVALTAAPRAAQHREPSRSTPAVIRLIFILSLLFGAGGVLLNCWRLAFTFMPNSFSTVELCGEQVILEPLEHVYIDHTINLILALTLFVCAFGVLARKPWGLRGTLLAAFGQLLIGTWELFSIATMPIENEAFSEEMNFAMRIAKVGSLMLLLITMIYPAIAIFLLRKSETRAMFDQPADPPAHQ